jgi:hypothetical protein
VLPCLLHLNQLIGLDLRGPVPQLRGQHDLQAIYHKNCVSMCWTLFTGCMKTGWENPILSRYRFLLLSVGFHILGKKQEHDGNGSSPMATGPETVELISCPFLRLPAFSQDNPVFDPIFWVLGSRAMAQRPACLVHSRSPSNI